MATWGAALALSFTNRNLFKGAERLLLKGRMAYEAIRGLEGYGNENYLEFSGEASLRFPPFACLSCANRRASA